MFLIFMIMIRCLVLPRRRSRRRRLVPQLERFGPVLVAGKVCPRFLGQNVIWIRHSRVIILIVLSFGIIISRYVQSLHVPVETRVVRELKAKEQHLFLLNNKKCTKNLLCYSEDYPA